MQRQPLGNPEFLTASGLAELFRVSVRTIQRIVKQPNFPEPVRVGKCSRWPKAEVLVFLRGRECAAEKRGGQRGQDDNLFL